MSWSQTARISLTTVIGLVACGGDGGTGPAGPQGMPGPVGPAGPQGPEGPTIACAAEQTLVYGGGGWTCSDAIADLAHGRSVARAGRSCASIKAIAPWAGDGAYFVDPDGPGAMPPIRVRCDMSRDGGGWTLVLKNRHASDMHGRGGGFGTFDDLAQPRTGFYKLPDATINAIIGDGTFDLLADQVGYNSTFSDGNHEYVLIRDYTASFTFTARMPESTTATVFESYRSTDDLLLWRGRLACGNVGGVGINCLDVAATPNAVGAANPQGGAGCLVALGTQADPGWHHVYMSQTSSETYLAVCNGMQHSSGHDLSHRWWVR